MANQPTRTSDTSASEPALLEQLARKHGFSVDAVRVLATAMARGSRSMAQFDHREFGGHGQWMRGGMLMIGDMFNNGLKARVGALCDDLAAADLPASAEAPAKGAYGDWWPAELGPPDSAGGQNGIRYAYFNQARRLIVERDGTVSEYDTGDHRISGVAQQQSDRTLLTFTSQYGPVDLGALKRM
jgi:hypothetical protein